MAARIVARWTFSAKFGMTQDAFRSISQWHATVGTKAWTDLKWTKADIDSRVTVEQGSIGALEQRFETRIEFDSLTELDQFFSAIPGAEHVEWGKNHSKLIEGNTKWEIYRKKAIQWN